MLNMTLKGTHQDSSNYSWDYYGDDADPSAFYIVPRPQFALNNDKSPSFQITRYETGGNDNGDGFLRFDVELAVPPEVEQAILQQIPQFFPNAKAPYRFESLAYNPGGLAYFLFGSGADAVSYPAPVSSFGSNMASFLLPMKKAQLDTVSQTFGTRGGCYEVQYRLTVPARLPAVTATLSFDSGIAYQYQVTQPSYDSWGDETSPGSVQTMLKESASSNVTISWGTATPSDGLRQAVSDWANDTLADLVSAEVQKAIQLQGKSSGESFSISEVSSFTSTYNENMVVNWFIMPQASLPSFPSLGLNVANFTSTVDERQQVMTVSAYLPFHADNSNTALPGGGKPALIERVDVVVAYPGLDESNGTYTFTENGSHSFSTQYNQKAGPGWTLDYIVTYVDKGTPQVKPHAPIAIGDSNNYTLDIPAAGILSVLFDAHQTFSGQGTLPQEVDIRLTYLDSSGAPLVQESATIKQTDKVRQASITSYYPLPISTKYNYQVTYIYPGGVSWTAPLVQGATGFSQIIPAANKAHSCNLIVYMSAASSQDNPLLDGPTVQVYYASDPSTPPGSGSQPTKDAPAVFTIPLSRDPKSNTLGTATFDGLLSGNQPLVYSAALDLANGQVVINDAMVENDQASLMITPTQRYFTIEVSPSAIAWHSAAFSGVEILIDAKVAQGSAQSPVPQQPTQRALRWNKGDTGSAYVTYGIQEGNTVSYDWKANFIFVGTGTKSAAGTGATDMVLNIPAAPAAS